MEIIYTLIYHEKVVRDDIPALNGSWKKKIKSTLESKLLSDPLLYGKPLRRDLHGCYKLRIGDYRVIYFLKESVVHVVAISHRREVYKINFHSRL
jgi:mRNA-degrading endonuclease RelE of RelBE toxin-antitoxin system